MKIRILNNSIRLRLSQMEIEQLEQGAAITGVVPFPNGTQWTYQLQAKDQTELFQAHLTNNSIKIFISKTGSSSLQESDRVGHEGILTTPNSTLKILVEKDFKCLTPRAEDESDLYENPNTKC